MKYVIIFIASVAFLASCQNATTEATETYIHPCMEEVSMIYADSTAQVNATLQLKKEFLWTMPDSPARRKEFFKLHKWHREELMRLRRAKEARMIKEYKVLFGQK